MTVGLWGGGEQECRGHCCSEALQAVSVAVARTIHGPADQSVSLVATYRKGGVCECVE